MKSPLRKRSGVLVVTLLAAVGILTYEYYQSPNVLKRQYEGDSISTLAKICSEKPYDSIAWEILGDKRMKQEDAVEAVLDFEHCAQLDPDNPIYRNKLAKAELASGQINNAFEQLRQFVGTHPHSARGYQMLGDFYYTERSYDNSVNTLKKSIQINPKRARGWWVLAAAENGQGYTRQAEQTAVTAYKLGGARASDLILLASLQISTGDVAAAIQTCQSGLVKFSDNADLYALLADAQMLEGGPNAAQGAVAAATKALQLDPRQGSAAQTLGEAYMELKEYPLAISPLKVAADQDRVSPAIARDLISCYLKLGNRVKQKLWESRFNHREKLYSEHEKLTTDIQIHPDQPIYQKEMAQLLAQQGDTDACIRHVAAWYKLTPDNSAVLSEAAVLLIDAHHTNSAISILTPPNALQTAGQLDKTDVNAPVLEHDVYVLSSYAARQMPANEHANALLMHAAYATQHFHAVVYAATNLLAISPNDAEAHAYLGIALSQISGDVEVEKQQLKEASVDPSLSSLVALGNGCIYFQQGMYSKAEKTFQKAVKQNPTSPEGWLMLSKAAKAAGDTNLSKTAALNYAKITGSH